MQVPASSTLRRMEIGIRFRRHQLHDRLSLRQF